LPVAATLAASLTLAVMLTHIFGGLDVTGLRQQSGRGPPLLNSARDHLVNELRGKYQVRFMGQVDSVRRTSDVYS
jgi:hypothetical protein